MSIQAAIKTEYGACKNTADNLEDQLQNAITQAVRKRILAKLKKLYRRIAELELLLILPSVSGDKPRAKRKKL